MKEGRKDERKDSAKGQAHTWEMRNAKFLRVRGVGTGQVRTKEGRLGEQSSRGLVLCPCSRVKLSWIWLQKPNCRAVPAHPLCLWEGGGAFKMPGARDNNLR